MEDLNMSETNQILTDIVTITRAEYDYLMRDKYDINALITLKMSDDSYLASRYLDQILQMRGLKA
jgi:hypothetical protein